MKPVKKHPVLLFFLCAMVTGLFTVFAIVMPHLQILQEERYLTAAFGAEYLKYRHQVLRYLRRLRRTGKLPDCWYDPRR